MNDKPLEPGPSKTHEIIINSRPYRLDQDEVTFDDVVNRAFPDGSRGPLITYTVLYFNAAGREPEGGLDEGGKVKIKTGTVFNVTRTDRS